MQMESENLQIKLLIEHGTIGSAGQVGLIDQ